MWCSHKLTSGWYLPLFWVPCSRTGERSMSFPHSDLSESFPHSGTCVNPESVWLPKVYVSGFSGCLIHRSLSHRPWCGSSFLVWWWSVVHTFGWLPVHRVDHSDASKLCLSHIASAILHHFLMENFHQMDFWKYNLSLIICGQVGRCHWASPCSAASPQKQNKQANKQ